MPESTVKEQNPHVYIHKSNYNRNPTKCQEEGGIFLLKSSRSDSEVLSLPIFSGDRTSLLCILHRRLEEKSGRPPLLLFTPNAEMLAAAKDCETVRQTLLSADLRIPDGIGVAWLSRGQIRHRIPGVEIGECLLRYAARHHKTVYLLGGLPFRADMAADHLRHRFAGLSIVGTHHGYFEENSEEEKVVLREIASLRPNLLFVCMGFPRQEQFLVRHRPSLTGVSIAAALGGAIDCYAGAVPRAPRIVRQCHIEWLYRTLQDPRRIPRLLRTVKILVRTSR
jgi:N-acetylglucosaminyldiphosphoundecaprenol N-acetyl-beta-D-mannosaminyltransferase